jgi:transcription antitermination factor NusG
MDSQNNSYFAIHVKARHEKAVARMLTERGYDSFLPIYRTRRNWSDRVKEVELPLFSCYVFCRLGSNGCAPILKIPGALRVVAFGNKPVAVADEELAAIRAIVASRASVEPWPFVCTGERVRIEHGCLRGAEGYLVRKKGRSRLIVNVTLLQRSCAVEIDGASVSPAGEPTGVHKG